MKSMWFQAAICTSALVLILGHAAVNGAPTDSPEPQTLDAVRAEVEALKKEDVAWRNIQWKTCLLDEALKLLEK